MTGVIWTLCLMSLASVGQGLWNHEYPVEGCPVPPDETIWDDLPPPTPSNASCTCYYDSYEDSVVIDCFHLQQDATPLASAIVNYCN